MAEVEEALSREAAVAILGPRQVGKTTLALAIAEKRNAFYLDLQSPDDREKLGNPALFLEALADRLVILDEVHRTPALFESLRGIIDKGRREGKGIGRFLILGSASLDLLRQSGETLAGRIAYVDLGPITAREVPDDHPTRERLWLRGGFPQSYLAADDRRSFQIRRDFIRTYLERDVPMFGPRLPATTIERLWTMLAHLQGSLSNASELARSLEVSVHAVTRYIDLLCDLLLVRRLQPYHANIGKRLVKSPKVYVRDSGIVHALLGLRSAEELAGHPVSGASWEGFVLETLIAALPWRSVPMFYRTAAGAEVDLIIEHASGRVWAVEIKRSLSAKPARGFYSAVDAIRPERSFVVYAGAERYPISETIEAIPLRALVDELAQAG
jgi:hypothetical protein